MQSRLHPESFKELKREFGWKPVHAASLVGQVGYVRVLPEFFKEAYEDRVGKSIIFGEPKEVLKDLVRGYRRWFVEHPDKAHVFPMAGTAFQEIFARAANEAFGTHARIIKYPASRYEKEVFTEHERDFARKLGLDRGIVMHDYVHYGGTRSNIAKAAGLDPKDVKVHRLREAQVRFERAVRVPLRGHNVSVWPYRLIDKCLHIKGGMMLTVPGRGGNVLPQEERKFLRDAIYASGYAAAKEVLAEEAKESAENAKGKAKKLRSPIFADSK